MTERAGFCIWNVHEGVTAVVGSQSRFNVLGRVQDPASTAALHGRVNDGPWAPIPVNLAGRPKGRLVRPGDFNFDTVDIERLAADNVLEIRQTLHDGREHVERLRFGATLTEPSPLTFELRLADGEIEQFCQVVDGDWRIVTDGEDAALAINRESAGYDRIVLFGDRRWTNDYEIDASLTVDAWTSCVHNVGLLFKWNPHEESAGPRLPISWSTGLAYYASVSPGLRLRHGVEVTYRPGGIRMGDHVLAERPVRWWSRLPLWLVRLGWYATGRRMVLSQLRPGVRYRFRARISSEQYTLAVWPASKAPPRRPQVVVAHPPEHLDAGSVGVIAQNAAVRVHEYSVRALSTSPPSEAPSNGGDHRQMARTSHQPEQR